MRLVIGCLDIWHIPLLLKYPFHNCFINHYVFILLQGNSGEIVHAYLVLNDGTTNSQDNQQLPNATTSDESTSTAATNKRSVLLHANSDEDFEDDFARLSDFIKEISMTMMTGSTIEVEDIEC